MARASGANSQLLLGFEATYGAATSTKVFKVPFSQATIGGDQQLIKDNLLGLGRNPQDPTLDVVTDEGDVTVPVDVRNFWLWLKLLMGAPTTTPVAARNVATFSAQPAVGSTIILNGTTWTFVAGSPSGNQIQIGANLAATMAASKTALNASAETQTTKCQYDNTATTLSIVFETNGVTGNAFTLAASANSNCTFPDRTLMGGGYKHVFESGVLTLPSALAEIGFPEVPSYGRNGGMQANTMKIGLNASGLLDAQIGLIGQKETTYSTPIDGAPTVLQMTRFAQFSGQILRDGVALSGITAAEFNYSNNFDKVQTIRPDGAIDGVDLGLNEATPTITSRFADTVLLDQAQSQLPNDLAYGWKTPGGFTLTIDHPRVFLPRPKRQAQGPQGISVTFNGIAAYDQSAAVVTRVTLINDLQASDYAA